jgi:dGTPase
VQGGNMKKFYEARMHEQNPKWNSSLMRAVPLYSRRGNLRSEFYRDYTRILHCTAYRRLKHKTQVFFATENDHICTRIEHVNHVASVSYTIADSLGLNTELVSAIAIGHDLGHAPFGHEGEAILKNIAKTKIGVDFWHEKNSLWFVDKIETLPNPSGQQQNLNLTYAVRDGIVSHCGEIDENAIFPRNERIDLYQLTCAGRIPPYTWEACVVKVADKIAYLGRDFEDALALKMFSDGAEKKELKEMLMRLDRKPRPREINNTVLMNEFISDLYRYSSPEAGICLSPKHYDFLSAMKDFNYRFIYTNRRLEPFRKYAALILNSIFAVLSSLHRKRKGQIASQICSNEGLYPLLMRTFRGWLIKYSDLDLLSRKKEKCANDIIYTVEDDISFQKAALDFISGMTDNFAIKCFKEITSFE